MPVNFFFSKSFEPTLNKSHDLWLISLSLVTASSTTTTTTTSMHQPRQPQQWPQPQQRSMVSPPFFFPLIFYALIYLSFVLATTITDHDDNWQPKKNTTSTPTNSLPTQCVKLVIATTVAAVAARDVTHLLELLVCLFYYYCTNFFRSPLCVEMAVAASAAAAEMTKEWEGQQEPLVF